MSDSTVALLSTAYLPPIDYFKVINREGDWRLERCDSYQKQSYRNRAHIYSANGLLPLYIPISRKGGSSPPILETKIDNSTNWQTIHWRALTAAYNSTPFFEYYSDDLQPLYLESYSSLFQFNCELLELILSFLGLSREVLYTEEYRDSREGVLSNDYRERIHPKKASPFREKERGYYQPFSEKFGFIDNLSIVDLLFNEGPNSISFL